MTVAAKVGGKRDLPGVFSPLNMSSHLNVITRLAYLPWSTNVSHLGFFMIGLFSHLSTLMSSFISVSFLVIHTAFEEFATSLVKQEMTNMPRGVYHSALRGGATRTDQGKTVAGIPNFLLKMYERNKQPGMTPGLAGRLSSIGVRQLYRLWPSYFSD